jgi:sugar lactone lactonase YvrE
MKKAGSTIRTAAATLAANLIFVSFATADHRPGHAPGGGPGGGTSDGQVFVSTSEREIWKVDLPSGNKRLMGSPPEPFFDLAVSPDGFLFGLDNSPAVLYRIDVNTGEALQIGDLGYQDDGSFNSMDFDANGNLYVARNRLLQVDPTTGAGAVIGDTGFEATGDLAIATDGMFYMSTFGSNGIDNLVQLDPTTGAGALIGSIGFSNVFGLDYVGDTLYGITDDRRVIEINPITGRGSEVRKLGIRGSVYGMAGIPATAALSVLSVPEPTTLTLVAFGAILLATFRDRRDSRQNLHTKTIRPGSQ